MRRRTFLLGGAAALAGLAGIRLALSTQHAVILSVLQKRLSYLKMSPEGMSRFADEVIARKVISPLRLRTLGMLMPLYQRLALEGREGWLHSVRHGEERITTMYLLSSDFFVHGAREDRVIQYLAFYDPEHNPVPCMHPFARPVSVPQEPPEAPPSGPVGAAAAAAAATAAR